MSAWPSPRNRLRPGPVTTSEVTTGETITETVAPEAPETSAVDAADHNDTVGHPADGRNSPNPDTRVRNGDVRMKSKQLKLVAAGIGAGAAVAMGALGYVRRRSRTAPAPSARVRKSRWARPPRRVGAPTEVATTFATPTVTAERPDGFETGG